MKKPLISVIVPIFNLGESLKKTVDSLLSQTYRNIEIILIDDGSIDNSLEICKKYELIDKRIKVYHSQNKGLSATRNFGINISHGSYISFIDGGDEVDPNLYMTLIGYINDNIDLIEYKHNVLTDKGVFDEPEFKTKKNILYDKQYIDDMILPRLLNIIPNDDCLPMCFVWKFLFKASIVNEHQIRFNEGLKKWEDREFVIDYLENCSNVIFLENVLITYDCRDSLPHLSKTFFDLTLQLIVLLKEREERFSYKYRFDTQYYYDYIAVVIVNNLMELFTNSPNMIADKLSYILDDNWTINIIKNWGTNDKENKRIKQSILSRDIESCILAISEYDETKNKKEKALGRSMIKSKIYSALKALRGAK